MTTIRIGEQPLSLKQVHAVSQGQTPLLSRDSNGAVFVELAEVARLRIARRIVGRMSAGQADARCVVLGSEGDHQRP